MKNRKEKQIKRKNSVRQLLGYALSVSLLAALLYSAHSVLFSGTAVVEAQEDARKVTIGTCILPEATAKQDKVDTLVKAFTSKNPTILQCEDYARELAPKADYDGDGYLNGSSAEDEDSGSPLMADLPELVYSFIGKTAITINMTERTSEKARKLSQRNELERSNSSEAATSSLISSTLARETTQSNTSTHTAAVEVSASFSFPFSASASAKAGYTYENSETKTSSVGQSQTYERGYSSSAMEGSRQLAEYLREESEQRGNKYQGGEIETTVRIINGGNAPIQIKDFAVAARERTGPGSNDFRSVATLKPDTKSAEFSRDLAPKGSIELPVKATISDLATMESLLENPTQVYFQVITPQMNLPLKRTDQQAESFSYVQDNVRKNNVWFYIDYGRGLVRNFYVSPKTGAKTFGDALKVLNLQFEAGKDIKFMCKQLASKCPDNMKVTADASKRMFWNVKLLGADNRREPIEAASNLADSTLRGGDSVFMVFVEDQDGDKIPRSEEVRYGTVDTQAECTPAIGCKTAADFDDDGLSDFEETQSGWKTNKGVIVFSNPLAADVDRDGWPDSVEKRVLSNPDIVEWSQGGVPGYEQLWTQWVQAIPKGWSGNLPAGVCAKAPVNMLFMRNNVDSSSLGYVSTSPDELQGIMSIGNVANEAWQRTAWKKDGSGFTVTATDPNAFKGFPYIQTSQTFNITTEDPNYGRGMYLLLNTPSCGTVKYYRLDSPNAYRVFK